MVRAATIAWTVAAVVILIAIFIVAIQMPAHPIAHCSRDPAGALVCGSAPRAPIEVAIRVALVVALGLAWLVSPLLLFAYLIGQRKSHAGAVIAAALGIGGGLLVVAYAMLSGWALTVPIALLAAVVISLPPAVAGLLSAYAAREIRVRPTALSH